MTSKLEGRESWKGRRKELEIKALINPPLDMVSWKAHNPLLLLLLWTYTKFQVTAGRESWKGRRMELEIKALINPPLDMVLWKAHNPPLLLLLLLLLLLWAYVYIPLSAHAPRHRNPVKVTAAFY